MSDVDTGIGVGHGFPPYLVEVWSITSIGLFIILLRWIVRLRTVGIRGLQPDDYMTLATLAFTCLDASTVTVAYHKGQNVEITEADLSSLTQADIHRLEVGSKYELTAWYSYVTLIWTLKFTMLLFYKRLTLGSWHQRFVNYLFWFVGAAYIGNFLVLTFGCYPFHLNWQVSPITPWKCSFRTQNFIGTAVFNIITDAAILVVPIPMLWKLKMPITKKVVIGVILSSGLFVIAAAIIRLHYSLDATPSAPNINRWGIRETIIAIFTVNIPILRPIVTRPFWRLGHYDASAVHSSSNRGTETNKSKLNQSRILQSQIGNWQDVELGHRAGVVGRSPPGSSGHESDETSEKKPSGIMQTRVVELTETDEEHLIDEYERANFAGQRRL